jgi:hypothetical protein
MSKGWLVLCVKAIKTKAYLPFAHPYNTLLHGWVQAFFYQTEIEA